MEEQGYIKLNRRLLKWGWYSDVNTLAVFIDILLHATYTEREYKGHKLKPGDAVIGRRAMAKRLGLSEQQIRTALKHLHETGEILTSKTTNRFTIVTVAMWDKYQVEGGTINQQPNQQATNKQPTSNHKQERKKERKKELLYYGNDDIMSDLFQNADKLPEIMERIGGEE